VSTLAGPRELRSITKAQTAVQASITNAEIPIIASFTFRLAAPQGEQWAVTSKRAPPKRHFDAVRVFSPRCRLILAPEGAGAPACFVANLSGEAVDFPNERAGVFPLKQDEKTSTEKK